MTKHRKPSGTTTQSIKRLLIVACNRACDRACNKVCVKACKKDTFNKETGLIYAIIKRLYANDVEKKTGYLRSTGLGEKISKLLAKATDQKEAERERRRAKKAAKKAQEANEAGEKAAEEAVEKVYEDELTGEKGC